MTAWRQFDLLKARNQRGKKPPPAPEFAVHCMVADTLARFASPGWWWGHYPAGENRDERTGARLKRMGTKAGVADFLLVAPPHGRLHALELKRRGSRPTEAQAAFLAAIEAAGGVAGWADGYEAAVGQLKAWGAVRASLEVAA